MVSGIAAGSDWQSIVAEKRMLRDHLIKPFLGEKTIDDSLADTGNVQELAKRIADGDVTSYDVTKAHILRACAAHEKSNCLTEILFAEALKRAKSLDTHLATHNIPIGPLHGVPMSLKDQFDVKGHDTTLGYVGRSFQPAQSNALLVDILQELGAVIIAKTNLPQSIMWCETENPLFGLTTNPRDARLTPGGSSGGEGVLLAERGSMIGWGTDIGGSVRIPAHMMGLYALKPSSGRLPYEGCQVSTSGQEHVPSVVGPMARSLASIEQVTRLVIGAKPWERDPTAHRLPWQEDTYQEIQSRPLVIGVLLDDGHVKVHPPIERVLREAVFKLKNAGHIVVPWSSEGHKECVDIMDAYYTSDGGEDIRTSVSLAGEPYLPHIENIITRAPAISVYQYWALNRRKRAAQKAYLEKWSRTLDPQTSLPVDILLSPTMPHPSVPHRSCKWVGYTKVWNLLDYTAVVLPFGKVDRDIDHAKTDDDVSGYHPRNETDASNWQLYDPEAMHGLPLSVQIVGQRLEEEKVLGAAKVIETVLRA